MKEYSYRVGDLKKLIKESSNEFKPVLGTNVMRDNKKNNDKSYKDSEKRAKDCDGGLKEPQKTNLPKKEDGNKTTLDYNPRTEPDKKYKERVKAQANGYTSKLEQDNDIEKIGEFDKNKDIEKQFSDSRDEMEKAKSDIQHSGLTARTFPKSAFDKNHLNENAPKPKRLIFKHTRFLNENQVLVRIPEEYKIDGQKIYMKDGYDNEYIVECSKSKTGFIETNIVNYNNQSVLNEQVNRIQELFDYKSSNKFGKASYSDRVNESANFMDIMNNVRKKM